MVKKNKGWPLALIGLLALLLALYTIVKHTPERKAPPTPSKLTPSVIRFEKALTGVGVVEPSSGIIRIGCGPQGIVHRVFVKPGQFVHKGVPLFALDTRELDAEIEMLRTAIHTAQIQGKEAHDLWDIALSLTDPRSISKEELVTREATTRIYYGKVEELLAQLNLVKIRRLTRIIKAPISGQILSVAVKEGEFVASTVSSNPYIRMGNTDPLIVRVDVDEKNAALIQTTAKAYGSLRGNAELRLPLRFLRFEPYIERKEPRVVQVIYEIEQGPQHIFVGQLMDVFIESGTP